MTIRQCLIEDYAENSVITNIDQITFNVNYARQSVMINIDNGPYVWLDVDIPCNNYSNKHKEEDHKIEQQQETLMMITR